MPRARSKAELITYGKQSFLKLLELLNKTKQLQLENTYVFENRTTKDVAAHLLAWHKLMDKWYSEGMAGNKSEIPALGYTFKTTPELNEKLYQEYKNMPWDKVLADFDKAHVKTMKLIESHTEDELFTKMKYKWTGSTSMGSYFASATSSHYNWAIDLLNKFIKKHK